MDWRSSGLAPTFPRPTMLALLGILCLLATVPYVEAMPLSLSSLPSLSSPSGVLLACLSVGIALTLVVALVLGLKKLLRRVLRRKGKKRVPQDVEEGTEQRREVVPPQPIELVPEDADVLKRSPQELEQDFYEFLNEWNGHSLKDKEEFIVEMVKEFPVAVTTSMVMGALHTMLREEVNPDIWFRMLRFIMMLERDLFHWDQTGLEHVCEGDKTIPSQTHQRFQSFLVAQAECLLRKYGDEASMDEDGDCLTEEGQAGFMRLVAFLFGFVCKDRRILRVMDDTWSRLGFRQVDASRAVVWGYRRWLEDGRRRVAGRATSVISSNGNHTMFYRLMQQLRGLRPVPRLEEGSRAQHLLFALGFGYEPAWDEGPLQYMSEHKIYPVTKHFYGVDYLWLMMGRDLALGSAWQWMCKKGLSEHDRMCLRFGQEGKLYEHVVDTVMKYEQDYCVEDGQCLMTYAVNYSPEIVEKVNFGEHRAWYERYQRSKKTIGFGMSGWLLKNDNQGLEPHVPRDPSHAVDHFTRVALQWEAGKKNGEASHDSE